MSWLGPATIAVLALATACGPSPEPTNSPGHPTTLASTSWRLVEIGGRAPMPGLDVTLQFTADRLGGMAPCNGYGAAYFYQVNGGALDVRELLSTKRACVDQARGTLEDAFFDALRTATEADMDPGGRLSLAGPSGSLVFVTAPDLLPLAPSADPGPS